MGTSGLGSLIFGRLFDRKGIKILIPLTLITTAFVPLVFWVVSGQRYLAAHYGGLVWVCMNQ